MSVGRLAFGQDEGVGGSLSAAAEALTADVLSRLERQVNLPAWLLASGFHLSPTQSDLNWIALSNRYGETLLTRKDPDRGVWTYSNPADPSDPGTIVDLLVRRDGATLDECANRLMACVDRANTSREAAAYREAIVDRNDTLHRTETRHFAAVEVERRAAGDLEGFGVKRGTFDEWRFGHASDVLRNPATLEHSRYRPSDREMVFLERPIDAVAYERTHGRQHACYVYTGDNPSDETKRKIAHLLADAPEHLKVVLAFGRDRAGSELAAQVARLGPAGHFERRPPEFGGRWSDQMQIERRHEQTRRHDQAQAAPRADPALESFRHVAGRALAAGVSAADIQAVIRRTAIVKRGGPER